MTLARILAAAAAVVAAAVVLAAPAGAETTKLLATVGPDFSITLTDPQGAKVTHLDPGQYEILVDDKSEFHNFRLTGPGVSVATGIEPIGQQTFQITLADGVYKYQCDAHPGDMTGAFAVGSASLPTADSTGSGGTSGSSGAVSGSTGKGAGAKASAPVGAILNLTVGPGQAITLRTKAGKPVTRLAAGAYTFVVRDRSKLHNAHLAGAGVNKATGIAFVGTSTLKLTLKKGKLSFSCDSHRTAMKGSVAIS